MCIRDRNQLFRQKQISEIKTDFINNMTHEFKTPIATINLALDAIKNPKVIDDKEKVFRYLQMIRDENKRMHAQVENVLRISKLEKNELNIDKEATNVHDIIEDAIEHVSLIVEDRNGSIETHFQTNRNIAVSYTHLDVYKRQGIVSEVSIEPCNEDDIQNTIAVMGGEDWQMWIDTMKKEGILANNAMTIAYSYIGPEVTEPVYRKGTIGRAKDHLEKTAFTITDSLKDINGKAYVSVNKALVTQASSAIPVIPLYISLLYKTMKAEGCLLYTSRCV